MTRRELTDAEREEFIKDNFHGILCFAGEKPLMISPSLMPGQTLPMLRPWDLLSFSFHSSMNSLCHISYCPFITKEVGAVSIF